MNVVETVGVPNPCKIVNVVSTYHLGLRLNLRKLALCRRDAPVKFNPLRFAAATVNLEDESFEKTTALCFGSGNMVHTGAITEEKARLQAHTLVRFMNVYLGIPAKVHNFTITNMVCDFKLGFEVDLDGIKEQLGPRAKYNSLKFPACRIKSAQDDKQVALVYFSGGTVLTGLKDRDGIRGLHKSTYDICVRHRYTPVGSVSKAELRLVDIKKATGKEVLVQLSKRIGDLTKKAGKQQVRGLKSAISKDRKQILDSAGKKGEFPKGTLYLGMFDPLASLDSSSVVPFVPRIKGVE